MNFGEKVRDLRRKKNMSQKELAEACHVTIRTIQSYEAGKSYPKKREIYGVLASVLECDQNYLLTEEAEFLTTASSLYGQRGVDQARAILEQTAAMFAGGDLSEDDKIEFLNEIQSLYLDSKVRAKKFTPKKYLDT